MTKAQARLFIALDEWLGVALILYLHKTSDPALWYIAIAWAIAVYPLSYVPYWLKYDRWWKRDG